MLHRNFILQFTFRDQNDPYGLDGGWSCPVGIMVMKNATKEELDKIPPIPSPELQLHEWRTNRHDMRRSVGEALARQFKVREE